MIMTLSWKKVNKYDWKQRQNYKFQIYVSSYVSENKIETHDKLHIDLRLKKV